MDHFGWIFKLGRLWTVQHYIPHDKEWARNACFLVVRAHLHTEYDGIHIVVHLDFCPVGLFVVNSADLSLGARE